MLPPTTQSPDAGPRAESLSEGAGWEAAYGGKYLDSILGKLDLEGGTADASRAEQLAMQAVTLRRLQAAMSARLSTAGLP